MTDDAPPRSRPPMPGETVTATPRTRALASVVDLLLVLALASGTAALAAGVVAPDVLAGLVVVVAAAPTLLVAAGTGRSTGKVVLRLTHVTASAPPDARPDLVALGVRWGLKWLVPIVMVVAQPIPWTWAVLWWAIDGAPVLTGGRRALHDLVAGTRVYERVTQAP